MISPIGSPECMQARREEYAAHDLALDLTGVYSQMASGDR